MMALPAAAAAAHLDPPTDRMPKVKRSPMLIFTEEEEALASQLPAFFSFGSNPRKERRLSSL
jgi:hypothetical protein